MTQEPNWEQNPYSEFHEYSNTPEPSEPTPSAQPSQSTDRPAQDAAEHIPVESVPPSQSSPVPPIEPIQPSSSQQPYPPYPPYGPPPNYGYGVPPTPPLTPLPLKEALRQLPRQYLRVLTKPSPATFAAEMNKAAWDIVLVQIIGYGVIATIISTILIQLLFQTMLISAFSNLPRTAALPPGFLVAYQRILLGTSISNVVAIPLVFFIGVGIQYGLAKLFKGQGLFLVQGYAALLYQIPLNLTISLLAIPFVFIPVAGILVTALLSFAVFVYSVVLNIFSLMAVHRLSGGKASAVVLLPYGAYLLFICGISFLYGILVYTIISQSFPR